MGSREQLFALHSQRARYDVGDHVVALGDARDVMVPHSVESVKWLVTPYGTLRVLDVQRAVLSG